MNLNILTNTNLLAWTNIKLYMKTFTLGVVSTLIMHEPTLHTINNQHVNVEKVESKPLEVKPTPTPILPTKPIKVVASASVTVPKTVQKHPINKETPTKAQVALAVNFALRNVGRKYVYGASRFPLPNDKRTANNGYFKFSKNNTFDCSSLVLQAFRPYVRGLPWNTRDWKKRYNQFGKEVPFSKKHAGDIVLYKHAHISILIDDKYVVEAKSRKAGVVISELKPNRVWKVIRLNTQS